MSLERIDTHNISSHKPEGDKNTNKEQRTNRETTTPLSTLCTRYLREDPGYLQKNGSENSIQI